jgi:hypothetical protein
MPSFSPSPVAHGWTFLPLDLSRRVRVGRAYRCPPAGRAARPRALDALLLGPEPVCCRVRLVAPWWTCEAKVYALPALLQYPGRLAAWGLRRERDAGREPDARSLEALAARRAWLRGERTDAELLRAGDAARAAMHGLRPASPGRAAARACWAATWADLGDALATALDATYADACAPTAAEWAARDRLLLDLLLPLFPAEAAA